MLTSLRFLEHAGNLVDAIGTPGFGRALKEAVVLLAPIDSFMILFNHALQPPVVLYEDVLPEERKVFYDGYAKGTYLLGPFYRACMDSTVPRFSLMSEIAPDGFFDSEFFRIYYSMTGLVDEAGYVLPFGNNSAIQVSIGRIHIARSFGDEEVRRLHGFLPMVSALIRRQWPSDVPPKGIAVPAFREHLKSAFESFGTSLLTTRERDVCLLMLRGHSSKSAGRILNISPETERVHRRNIYEKLDITSQVELCSLFFESLAWGPDDAGTDPLARVLEYRKRSIDTFTE